MGTNLFWKEFGKVLLTVLVWVVIGQIPTGNNLTLENRYHQAVTSTEFRAGYRKTMWMVARPITWTGEQITRLFPHGYNLDSADKVEKAKDEARLKMNEWRDNAKNKYEEEKGKAKAQLEENTENLKARTKEKINEEVNQAQEYMGGR